MAKELLTDSFGRIHTYLRISLTQACNFKCGYCVGKDGHGASRGMPTSQLQRLLRLFAGAGIEKVRLTGGEPTLREDLPEIVRSAKEVRGIKHVGITTNGLVLKRVVKRLADAGLDSANISMDSLVPGKFAFITKVDGFPLVWQSFLSSLPLLPTVKLNTVVMKGFNEDELLSFVELSGTHRIPVRFIEYMPFPGNRWSLQQFISVDDMKAIIEKRFRLRKAKIRDKIADYYEVEGQGGMVGFIGSISTPFCDECNRIRLTADGGVKVCLHDNQETMIDLNKPDDLLLADIRAILLLKKRAHEPASSLSTSPNRSMSSIGG